MVAKMVSVKAPSCSFILMLLFKFEYWPVWFEKMGIPILFPPQTYKLVLPLVSFVFVGVGGGRRFWIEYEVTFLKLFLCFFLFHFDSHNN